MFEPCCLGVHWIFVGVWRYLSLAISPYHTSVSDPAAVHEQRPHHTVLRFCRHCCGHLLRPRRRLDIRLHLRAESLVALLELASLPLADRFAALEALLDRLQLFRGRRRLEVIELVLVFPSRCARVARRRRPTSASSGRSPTSSSPGYPRRPLHGLVKADLRRPTLARMSCTILMVAMLSACMSEPPWSACSAERLCRMATSCPPGTPPIIDLYRFPLCCTLRNGEPSARKPPSEGPLGV